MLQYKIDEEGFIIFSMCSDSYINTQLGFVHFVHLH